MSSFFSKTSERKRGPSNRGQATDPSRAKRSPKRRQLAQMGFEDAAQSLSPDPQIEGGPTVDSASRRHDTNHTQQNDPADLDALTYENYGTDLAAYSWNKYVFPGEKGADQENSSWRRGKFVRGLQTYRASSVEGRESVAHMDTSEMDEAMGANANEIQDKEGEVQLDDGVLTIERNPVQLFHNGTPDIQDMAQGSLGDCYLLATLNGMANTAQGRAQLTSIVRQSGAGFAVDFHRLSMSNNNDIQVRQDSKLRVAVSRWREGTKGVRIQKRLEQEQEVSGPEMHALIEQHGCRYMDPKAGWFRKFRGWFKNTPAVSRVVIKISPQIVWPWVVEKAYAAVAGGYPMMGRGGKTSIPMLALMGQDSTKLKSEWGDETMDPTEAALAFNRIDRCIQNGGTATVATRKKDKMRGPLRDEWEVTGADREGLWLARADDPALTSSLSWRSVPKRCDPFILVEDASGSLVSLDPANLTDENKEMIIEAANAQRTVEVKLTSKLYAEGLSIVPGHAYTAIEVNPKGLKIRNPWGGYQPQREVQTDEYTNYFYEMALSDTNEDHSNEIR